MPTTPVWGIPYPEHGTNPDIPRDMEALAEKIDTIAQDPIDLARVGRAFIWENNQWKPMIEQHDYDETHSRWRRVWYGPRIPHFWPPATIAPSNPVLGDSVTVSGGIVDQHSLPITEGTVVLMRQDAARTTGWREVTRGPLNAQGRYTLDDPDILVVGDVIYKVVYLASNIRYEDREDIERPFVVMVPKVVGLHYSVFAADHVELAWTAVRGADGYEIYEDGVLVGTVTSATSGRVGIVPGSVPHWKVRAFKNNSAGNPIYGPFSDELFVVGTVVTWTTQPTNGNYGAVVTLAGQVTNAAGNPVTVGTINLLVRKITTGAWTQVKTLPITSGVWSTTVTYDFVGQGVRYRAEYVPPTNAPEQPSSAESNVVTVGIGTVGELKTGAASHTSCTISWDAVPGATRYEIGNGTTVISGGTLGAVTSKAISVAANTDYAWRVRASRQDENGNWVVGGWSPILNFNGGRPEVRDSGQAWVHKDCVGSGCHRNDTGWNNPYVRQGYFSTPYGGDGYVGIYDYGDWGVANKIISDLGRARYDNGWASAGFTKVYKRGDVGSRSCTNVQFFSGTSWVGGPRPGLVRHGVTAWICYNTWVQINFSADMAMDIAKQRSGARNIAIYVNNSADYCALNNHTAGPEDGDIWVLWNWNFVVTSYIAPRWWR